MDMINPEKFTHWEKRWTANTSFVDQKMDGIDKNNIARHREIITEEEMFLIERYGNQFRFDDGISAFFGDEPRIRNNSLSSPLVEKIEDIEKKLNLVIKEWESATNSSSIKKQLSLSLIFVIPMKYFPSKAPMNVFYSFLIFGINVFDFIQFFHELISF
jgi:hypothetical protein